MLSFLSPLPPPPRRHVGHMGAAYEEEDEDDSQAGETIPRDSWMTPYIFARLPACMFQGASLALGGCSHEAIEDCIMSYWSSASSEASGLNGDPCCCGTTTPRFSTSAIPWDDVATICASPPPEYTNTHPSVFADQQQEEAARDFLAGVVPIGWCAVSLDPSSGIWEACNLLLWQNCLFELSSGTKTSTLRQNNITGYAHLSEADVTLCGITANADCLCNSSVEHLATDESKALSAVCVSYWTSCASDATRRTVWLHGDSEESTRGLAGMLVRASKLTVSRLYSKSRLLGQGAFGEVFEAVRRPAPWGGPLRSFPSFGVALSAVEEDEDSLKRCALKILSKNLFWNKVDAGQERSDAIVRETVTQLLAFLDSGSQVASPICIARSEREDCGLDLFWAPSCVDESSPFDYSSRNSCTGASAFKDCNEPELSASNNLFRYIPIVRLFRIFETRSEYVFELELMDADRGDLASVVQKHGPLSEGHAASIVIQLIIAASICHSHNVIHRDIKLQNVVFPHARVSVGESDKGRLSGRLLLGTREVVSGPAADAGEKDDPYLDEGDEINIVHSDLQRDRSRNDELKTEEHQNRRHVPVKLADFGMADSVDAFARLTGRCGTLGYVAPEIILSDGCANYGYKVDLFSIGCLAFALLSGEEPFQGCDSSATLRANTQGALRFDNPAWSRVSFAAQDWISLATCPFEAQRMNLRQALAHSWLRSHLAHWETII